jgi:hypothetical protein
MIGLALADGGPGMYLTSSMTPGGAGVGVGVEAPAGLSTVR